MNEEKLPYVTIIIAMFCVTLLMHSCMNTENIKIYTTEGYIQQESSNHGLMWVKPEICQIKSNGNPWPIAGEGINVNETK